MTKPELIEAISKKTTGLKKKDVEAVLDAYYETITETLAHGNNIGVKGFGTFAVHERKATTARNPQTGEKIDVPAKKVVKFSPAKQLKEAVEG
ncbi:MAG: integration host factor subunit beta [Nitrospirae bacterium]|nr:integration host factor subunit beta [Nitrospirota bacterium]